MQAMTVLNGSPKSHYFSVHIWTNLTLSMQEAVEVHWIVRRRGSHIFSIIGSQMAMKLLAFLAGHPLPPGIFLVLIFVRVSVDPRDIVWLEGLGQFKTRGTSLGIEPATFWLVA
jgi:hypothetical protein